MATASVPSKPENKASLPPPKVHQSEILTVKVIILDASSLDKTLAAKWKDIASKLGSSHKLACSSALSFDATLAFLKDMDLSGVFQYIITKDQLKRPIPSPEIFYRCCMNFGISPKQVLVITSSESSLAAAKSSGCHVLEGKSSLQFDDISLRLAAIQETQDANPLITQWQQTVQVVIPVNDHGDEFLKAGFGFPAPLIEVNGKLMIQNLVENLNMSMKLIFVVSQSIYEKYNMKYFLETVSTDPVTVVLVDDAKEKAMNHCALVLECKEHIDLNHPVIITSCSQYLEWDSNSFLYSLANPLVDGGILTFQNTHPRYAYASLDEQGWVSRCELHKPISNIACAGIFYWKTGHDLIKYSALVVTKGLDVKNKFAIALAFQEALKDGKRIKNYQCRRMWELSTPKDLEYFLMVQQKSTDNEKSG